MKTKLFKPLLQLVGASFVAQIVSFIVMPIITRLHTPDSLGQYQFFTTTALVLTPLMTGSLGLAIQSAGSKYIALSYLKVAMQYALIVFSAAMAFSPLFVILLLREEGGGWFAFYIPALIFFMYLSANFQFAMAYLTNNKSYASQSSYAITKSCSSNFFKIVLSWFSSGGFSLVLALILAEVLQLVRMVGLRYRAFIRSLFCFKWRSFKRRLFALRKYPTYVSMTSVLAILMNWFPILIAGTLYGPQFAGLLGLAFMVVNTPVYPIIGALRSVCFGELARGKDRKYFAVYSRSVLISAIPGALGLVVLNCYGGELFSIVFGEEWRVAGHYAFICFIPIAISLILSPVYSTLNLFFGFQRAFFLINFISLTMAIVFTSYVAYKGFDFNVFLVSFAASMVVNHILLFSISLILAFNKPQYIVGGKSN